MKDVLIIHPEEWKSFYHEMYEKFHAEITSLYQVHEVQSNAEATLALDANPKPKAVLLVHGDICDERYRKTIRKVITYAKNGGTVIMCLNFASFLKPSQFEEVFNKGFGLTWQLGNYTRETSVLNDMFNKTFSKPLESSYSMKALHISKASEHCRVYAYPRRGEAGAEMYHQSPIVLERYTESGFIGYVGDVNNEYGSRLVILGMLAKAIKMTQQAAPRDGSPTGLDDVPAQTTAPNNRTTDNVAQSTPTTTNHTKNKKKKGKTASKNLSAAAPAFIPGSTANSTTTPGLASSQPTPPHLAACAVCQKPGTSQCGACGTVKYCSVTCQKSAWPTHKQSCTGRKSTKASNKPNHSATDPFPQRQVKPPVISLHDLNSKDLSKSQSGSALNALASNGKLDLFGNKPRAEVFRRLIDIYRLRVDDAYVWDGELVGLYEMRADGQEDPVPIAHFNTFLNKAQASQDFLPSWWDPAARKECVRLAVNKSGGSFIGHAVEKSDIQEEYDPMMPMLMRMLGEQIYGTRVGSRR